jgi:L-rhamnose isomerase
MAEKTAITHVDTRPKCQGDGCLVQTNQLRPCPFPITGDCDVRNNGLYLCPTCFKHHMDAHYSELQTKDAIRIAYVNHNNFSVRVGGEWKEDLCWDEAIGLITRWIVNKQEGVSK